MKRFYVAVCLVLAACGGDGDDDDVTGDGGGGGDGGMTMTGTVSGTTVGGPISFPGIYAETTGGPNNSVRIYFMNKALGCGWQTQTCTDKPDLKYLTANIAPPPPYTAMVTPGTYGGGAGNFLTEAYLVRLVSTTFCGGGTATELEGFEGTLTIATRTATEITGSLDITMRQRGGNPAIPYRMTGSFTAPICAP
jgi:hypothetical protein